MGITLGFLCLICFLLLAAKIITRRCHLERMDRILMKLHKPVSGLFFVLCFLHIIFVSPVLRNRSAAVLITGIVSVVLMLLLICLCHMIKDKGKRMWWHRALTLLMVIGIANHIVTYVIDFKAYQQKVAGIAFEDIDLTEIEDGVYIGEYDAGYIYAKVEVEIKDGEIIAVNLLEHRNERGESAESILDDVVANQKIDVDTVSGATNSSNVIKKAIEEAIRKEIIE